MDDYQAPNGKPYRDWRSVFADAKAMPWTALNTGFITGALKNNTQPETLPPHRDPKERYNYAVMVFHFRHPTRGDILIDAGFDRSFHDHPPFGSLSLTMRLYSGLLGVRYTQSDVGIDLGSHLEAKQITPAHVFLTHLHADHTAGLSSIPSESHLYYGKREGRLLSRLLCGNHLKGNWPVHLLDMSAARTFAPFSHAMDVFGDGTFWAISTPGHTPDHLAYLINTTPNPILVVGDAELTTWAMQDEILVSTADGSRGRREVQRSADMIRTFHAEFPDVQVWFSHDVDHL